jgi:hypothetical protein
MRTAYYTSRVVIDLLTVQLTDMQIGIRTGQEDKNNDKIGSASNIMLLLVIWSSAIPLLAFFC